MSAVNGANRTKANSPTSANILDPGQLAGKVRVMTDTYEAVALVADSVITIGRSLPIGARILNVILAFDALGAARLSVGDSTDPDRYIDAADVDSAGIVEMSEGDNIDGLLYEILSTTRDIIITTYDATITNTIKIIVFYTCE